MNAHLHELGGDAVHVLGDDVLDEHLTARGGHGGHVGTGLDLVGDDAVAAAGELLHAADADGVRAGALDVRAHGVEEVREVDDMRLLGGVFDRGDAIGEDGGHHDVHRRADADHVEIDGRALEAAAPGRGVDEVALRHVRAHRAEALDVLVDRTYTEVAAAGHGDRCLTEAAEQRAEQIVARADLAREVIAGLGRVDAVAVDLHGVLVEDLHLRTHVLEDSEQERHVADLRDVLDAAHAVDEQSGRNDGNCGIFRAADRDLAEQGTRPVDNILIQNRHPLLR